MQNQSLTQFENLKSHRWKNNCRFYSLLLLWFFFIKNFFSSRRRRAIFCGFRTSHWNYYLIFAHGMWITHTQIEKNSKSSTEIKFYRQNSQPIHRHCAWIWQSYAQLWIIACAFRLFWKVIHIMHRASSQKSVHKYGWKPKNLVISYTYYPQRCA